MRYIYSYQNTKLWLFDFPFYDDMIDVLSPATVTRLFVMGMHTWTDVYVSGMNFDQ